MNSLQGHSHAPHPSYPQQHGHDLHGHGHRHRPQDDHRRHSVAPPQTHHTQNDPQHTYTDYRAHCPSSSTWKKVAAVFGLIIGLGIGIYAATTSGIAAALIVVGVALLAISAFALYTIWSSRSSQPPQPQPHAHPHPGHHSAPQHSASPSNPPRHLPRYQNPNPSFPRITLPPGHHDSHHPLTVHPVNPHDPHPPSHHPDPSSHPIDSVPLTPGPSYSPPPYTPTPAAGARGGQNSSAPMQPPEPITHLPAHFHSQGSLHTMTAPSAHPHTIAQPFQPMTVVHMQPFIQPMTAFPVPSGVAMVAMPPPPPPPAFQPPPPDAPPPPLFQPPPPPEPPPEPLPAQAPAPQGQAPSLIRVGSSAPPPRPPRPQTSKKNIGDLQIAIEEQNEKELKECLAQIKKYPGMSLCSSKRISDIDRAAKFFFTHGGDPAKWIEPTPISVENPIMTRNAQGQEVINYFKFSKEKKEICMCLKVGVDFNALAKSYFDYDQEFKTNRMYTFKLIITKIVNIESDYFVPEVIADMKAFLTQHPLHEKTTVLKI